MIDTIRLEIRGIPKSSIDKARKRLVSHLVVDNATGQISSEFTKGSLLGSWDSRVSVMIKDKESISFETVENKRIGKFTIIDEMTRTNRPVLVACDEYLVVEFSLPKWWEGVNFLNSSIQDDLIHLWFFRKWLEQTLDVQLPDLGQWLVKRLDISYCFDLKSYQHIVKYVQSLRNLDFPRRNKPQFYQDSFFCKGSTTTIKGYSKETEFKAHDFKRIASATRDKILASQVHDLTKGLFRFEVEFHHRKLKSLGVKTVELIEEINWGAEMDKEIFKLLKGAKTGKVHKFTDILETLNNANLKGSGVTKETCCAIWSTIVLEGQKYAKTVYGKNKYYRALNVFNDLGLSVQGMIQETKIAPILTEVNLSLYDKHNSCDLRSKYEQLFKYAA